MSTPRTCPTCGAQVSDAERFCANCGSRLPDAPPPPASEPPAASPTIVLRPESEPTQVLPSIPPAQPSPPQGTPAAPPASPFGLPSAPSGPPQGGSAFNVPPSSGAPAAPARRGLPLWVMILLGVLGLCVVGCGVTFVGLTMIGQSASEEIFASIEAGVATAEVGTTSEGVGGLVATREPEPTDEPAEEPTPAAGTTLGRTAEAEPAPTGAGGIVGGAIGGANDGPARTAEAQTAEAAEASAGAEQTAVAATAEIDQIFAGANVVFSDEFVDNRNNWFTGIFEEIEEDRIEDGVFKVIWSDEGSSYELYEVRELSNFVSEVDCLIREGGVDASCGLVFGQKNDVGFYKYEVFEDYYRLFTVSADADPELLVEGDPAGIIKPGEPNRLRVIKRGEEIRIYLNGVQLDALTDATYGTGKVGVSTNSYIAAGPAEVWFDNFTVWELP